MRRVTSDSALWLGLAAGLFTAAELTLAPLHAPLGWDEITYIAQTSVHASPILLPPGHSRGVGLLAAPVTLLTTSVVALRVWMAVLAGGGLFAALLAWRGLRPAWVLALAGLMFGGLAATQFTGIQVEADLWEALGALAVAGLVLQAISRRRPARVTLPLIAAGVFFLILVRIEDAAFIVAPMIAAVTVVPAWRNRGALNAIGAGIVAGSAEWVGEAYAFYGGPGNRLRLASLQPPRLGWHFSLLEQIRVLDGPAYCGPGAACHDWYPWLGGWWLALLALAILGIAVTAGAPSVLPGACALFVLAGYTLFVPYAAGRYLLPVFALVAVPAADGAARLITAERRRPAAVLAVSAFLLTGLISQHQVLTREFAGMTSGTQFYATAAADLRQLGVRAPCAVDGGAAAPVAYYLGCSRGWHDVQRQVLLAPMRPRHPARWRRVRLAGTAQVAYIRPALRRPTSLAPPGPRGGRPSRLHPARLRPPASLAPPGLRGGRPGRLHPARLRPPVSLAPPGWRVGAA